MIRPGVIHQLIGSSVQARQLDFARVAATNSTVLIREKRNRKRNGRKRHP